MTAVEFHSDVGDVLDFSCRLLRKAYRQGTRVAVIAPANTLAALDRALWTFADREFVPHALVVESNRDSELARRAPIWLIDNMALPGAPDILVNVGFELAESLQPPEPLQALQAFRRLIEVVSLDVDDAARARARWRHYRSLGLEVKHHRASAEAADLPSYELGAGPGQN